MFHGTRVGPYAIHRRTLDGAGVGDTLGAGDGEDGAINIGKKTAAAGGLTRYRVKMLNRNVVPAHTHQVKKGSSTTRSSSLV